jgi:hypothetical protein
MEKNVEVMPHGSSTMEGRQRLVLVEPQTEAELGSKGTFHAPHWAYHQGQHFKTSNSAGPVGRKAIRELTSKRAVLPDCVEVVRDCKRRTIETQANHHQKSKTDKS